MLPALLGRLEHASSADSSWRVLRTQEAGNGWNGLRPPGTRLLLLRAFTMRDIGLIAGSLGVLLGFTGVLLTLRVVVLAVLLGGRAMRFRCNLVLLCSLRVRLLYHFQSFCWPEIRRSQKRR
jgi:hypothetical protein